MCILLMIIGGSSSEEGVLGFFGLAVLIILPIIFSKQFRKISSNSADEWLKNHRIETQADQIDYQTNMEIYRNMMRKAELLKRQAYSTGGHERNQLLKEADSLERDARKYYRSLI